MIKDYTVYILYSEKRDQYYIGQTSDWHKRAEEHLKGDTKSTKGVSDWKCVFLQAVDSRKKAMNLERRIKGTKSRRSIERYISDERNVLSSPVDLSYMGKLNIGA